MSLVNQSKFAAICGVNRSTVTRWIQNGRIQLEQDGLIDVDMALRMRSETESPLPHHQARKAQFDEARVARGIHEGKQIDPDAMAQIPGTKKPGNNTSNVSHAMKLETWKLQKSKAELAAIEVDQMTGVLIEMSEVEMMIAHVANALRLSLEVLPDRISGQIAAQKGKSELIHKELKAASDALVTDIFDLIQRKFCKPKTN